MAAIDTVFVNALMPDGVRRAVAVAGGRIAALLDGNEGLPPARKVVDVGGRLMLPGFVEGHIHLDTSFFGDRWQKYRPNTDGFDVRERVAFQMENIRNAAPMADGERR